MQTQQGKLSIFSMAKKLFKTDGVLGFYNGLSASVLRQVTESTRVFAWKCTTNIVSTEVVIEQNLSLNKTEIV